MAENPRAGATATRSRRSTASRASKGSAGKTAPAGKAAPEKAASTTTKAPKYHPCKCLIGTGKQCPGETTRAFARGHDAAIASRLAQAVATDQMTGTEAEKLLREAGGTDLLVGKMKHSAQLRKDKTAEASKAAADRKAGKSKETAAKETSSPAKGKSPVGQEVQIDHDGKQIRGVIVRNGAGDLVARHRHQGKNCDHPVES